MRLGFLVYLKRRSYRAAASIALLTFVIVSLGDRMVSSFCINVASVILNKALWQEQVAIDRQRSLSLAARLLDVATGELPTRNAELASGAQPAMIPSIAIAEHHRRRRDFALAAFWLHQAASAPPCPSLQDPIVVPAAVSVTSQGDIVLDWSSRAWHFRADSQPADEALDNVHGWLTISFRNTPGVRDKVVYEWWGRLAVPYWHTLQMRVRIHEGTFLTMETNSRAGSKRHLHYHQGSGQWETFTIPLEDDELRFVYISLSEPSANPTVPDYGVDIEPLTLLLDQAAGGCEP